MSKSKQLATADEINESHRMARTCAETAVQHAIRCGQLLLAKKKQLAHGEFESWRDQWCEFGKTTAAAYMKAAKSDSEGIAFNSLRSLFPPAPKKALPNPKRKTAQSASDEGQKFSAPNFSSEISREISPISEKNDPVKGDVVAVVEAPKRSPTDPDWEPEKPDMEALDLEADQEYRAAQDRVIQADDRLAAMSAELQKMATEIAALKSQRDAFMGAKDDVLAMLKKEQGKTKRLEKELKKAHDENEALRERIAIMEAA